MWKFILAALLVATLAISAVANAQQQEGGLSLVLHKGWSGSADAPYITPDPSIVPPFRMIGLEVGQYECSTDGSLELMLTDYQNVGLPKPDKALVYLADGHHGIVNLSWMSRDDAVASFYTDLNSDSPIVDGSVAIFGKDWHGQFKVQNGPCD